MTLNLLPDETIVMTSKANAVIVPSDYGLSQFASGQLLGIIGMGNREAIGGHLHITTARLVFQAHAFNRLKGVLSIPIPSITSAQKYRSGLAVGIQIETLGSRMQFVNWSGEKVLTAIESVRRGFGAREEQMLATVADALQDLSVRPAAEVANVLATVGITLSGATPTWIEALSLIEWRTAADRPIRIVDSGTGDGA
jgi:hypothetical protein